MSDNDVIAEAFCLGQARVYNGVSLVVAQPMKEVLRIAADGRVWWNGREVETDDDLRAALRDVHRWLLGARETRLPIAT